MFYEAKTTIKLVLLGFMILKNEGEIPCNYLVFEKMPEMLQNTSWRS